MITIRSRMFETNSSSCHVFVFDAKSDPVVPATVELVVENNDTPLNTLFNDFYIWYNHSPKLFEEDMADFIQKLYDVGVGHIKCKDNKIEELALKVKTGEVYARHTKCPEKIARALFSIPVHVIELEDYEDFRSIIEERFGPGKDYISRRLS